MKIKIVFGSPCSGKTTYCKENLKENDIVYDYDELSNALTYGKEHEIERTVTHNIIDFRMQILNRIKTDDKVDTLYFITSNNPNEVIERIGDVEYEIIDMKTTFDECLKNLDKDEKRKDKEKWKERIENWFKEFRSMIPKEKLENRQFRQLQDIKFREQEENCIVNGYAAKWEPYVLYENREGVVKEKFSKSSFDGADLTDVIFLYDHKGKVLARNSNGTLKLKLDDIGLYIEADLSTSEAAKEMYREIKSGLVNKMSWSFKTGEYHFDKKTRTIIHDSIKKVYDVSAVGIPANCDTEINARNFCDGVIAKIETERLKNEQKRKKLKLIIELEKEIGKWK